MIEPPPHVLDPGYRELWHAACLLLAANSSGVGTADPESAVGNPYELHLKFMKALKSSPWALERP
jgi:hypothetical protein